MKTKNDVQEIIESQQAILIDFPMDGVATLSDVDVPEDEFVPLSKVYIDRNHFLNEDGTPKQFVKVNITVGGVPTPYYIDCVNASGVGDQLEYLGAKVTDPMATDQLQNSTIIGLDIIEVVGDFPEADGNHFDVNISFRYSLAGSFKDLGLVRSAVSPGASAGYTVPAAINEFGEIYVPTYPTLESLNAEHKVCEVHIDFIDGVYRSDTTWATIRSHVGAFCYLYYNDREYRYVGPSPTDMQAHYFVYEGNLVRDCFTINRSDDIMREETIITPSSDTYGGIKADEVSDGYNVPAKFNPEDGRIYVPTYPTLESLKAKPRDFIVTVTYDDSSYASDKTFDEIKEAYDSGRDCYAVYNMITCKLMSITSGAAIFMLYNGLAQNTIVIYKKGIVTHHSSDQIPSPTNYGGVRADAVDDARYSVPVKFNPEDGKLYVPVYPSDFSDYIVTATITGDQSQGFQSNIDYSSLLAVRNTVLIVYQETGDVYNPSSADEITGAISATNVKITETGVKISTFTFSSDNSVAYSEKEIPVS